jgi:tRNA(His) guanylyltransferase
MTCRFSDVHAYEKPNDVRGLRLMTKAALRVAVDFFPEIVLAYGQSDEFSFVFKRDTNVYNRRRDKLITNVASQFAAAFVFHWKDAFGEICFPSSNPLLFRVDVEVVPFDYRHNFKRFLAIWRELLVSMD